MKSSTKMCNNSQRNAIYDNDCFNFQFIWQRPGMEDLNRRGGGGCDGQFIFVVYYLNMSSWMQWHTQWHSFKYYFKKPGSFTINFARLRNVEDNLAFKCFCIIPLWEGEHMFSGWSIGDKLVLSYFLSLTSFINMLIDARSEGEGKIKKQIKQHIMI